MLLPLGLLAVAGAAQAQALPGGQSTALPLTFGQTADRPERFQPRPGDLDLTRAPPEPDRSFQLRWQDGDRQWDISAASRLVEESQRNAVDFQTGGLFETEAAIVRRFGPLRIGAAGYSARAAGDQVKAGPRLGAMRWQGNAAGPVVGYDAKVFGRPATLSVRWYQEFDTPGERGDTASVSMAVRF